MFFIILLYKGLEKKYSCSHQYLNHHICLKSSQDFSEFSCMPLKKQHTFHEWMNDVLLYFKIIKKSS